MATHAATDAAALLDTIRSSVIGAGDLVDGPFGPRPVVYADYTASGRSLSFLEDYLRNAVLPLYANTHTESSGTGRQTTRFREDARRIISSSVGASAEEHAVLFCGSGSTHAIHKMIAVLGLSIPSNLDDEFDLSAAIPADRRPVVFIGPYEHHSNELPWRESIADVVVIGEDSDGHVDLAQLEAALEAHADRPLRIGSFSAASNVTGITTDTAAVSVLLHRHGALAFWDFAAAAPYVDIDLGHPARGDDYFDAVFISPHKFIGGPGTPGVLVARRALFTNRVPAVPGGGTVAYVNADEHDYLPDIEHREEGGTPAIVESIRAGLVFQLKGAVGVDEIRRSEERFVRRAVEAWEAVPSIEILGSHDAERLSIVSFVIGHRRAADTPNGVPWYLHHNFVVALLDDLFGIQSRGGCSCAGPYGHRLLGIDLERSHEFEAEITQGCEGIKPGWVRINFNYFIDDATFEYLVAAVRFVAEHGAAFLPAYEFEPTSGLWRHRAGHAAVPMSLDDVDYSSGSMRYPDRRLRASAPPFAEILADAERHGLALADAEARPAVPVTSPAFERLRWFPYPSDAPSAVAPS